MPEIDLYIIGATTRATADMARRAGLSVGCFDSYADFDLRSHATYVQLLELENYTPKLSPLDFKNIVNKTPWVYGGPLENSPDWLTQAQEGSNCWGNLATSNLLVRNIWTLSEQVRQTGFSIQCPQILKLHEIPQQARKWLVKPFAGTGGWEIQPARKWLSSHRDTTSKHFQGYWQKRIQGPTFGASIISDGRSAIVAGICRSLHGTPGRPFAYRGSIGPIRSRLIQKLHPELTQLAHWLTCKYQIQGLWNIDLVYDRRTRKWFLLEVNHRRPWKCWNWLLGTPYSPFTSRFSVANQAGWNLPKNSLKVFTLRKLPSIKQWYTAKRPESSARTICPPSSRTSGTLKDGPIFPALTPKFIADIRL